MREKFLGSRLRTLVSAFVVNEWRETRVRVNSREKGSVDARDSWMELIFLKLRFYEKKRERFRLGETMIYIFQG